MSDSDELAQLLSREFEDPQMQRLLQRLDVPWKPQVTAERRDDWITFANVELGFEDPAYFKALGAAPARGSPILQQVCFYAPRPADPAVRTLQPPMGLTFLTQRAEARALLDPKAVSRRYGLRDVFEFEGYTASLAYVASSATVDTMLLLADRATRPSRADPTFGFAEIRSCFDLPWYHPTLRGRFYSLTHNIDAIGQIKSHGTFSLVREAGLRLLFEKSAVSWVLRGCEIYRSRVLDAATWMGDLPCELEFGDSPEGVTGKLGSPPDEWRAGDLEAYGSWHAAHLNIVVTFDLIVNLIASIRVTRVGS
jgi:hypothetical protein